MDQRPRHFHANERFFIEVTFEEALPEGALPVAEFAGPIGPGGPALTFWTSTSSAVQDAPGDLKRVRVAGQIPAEAPPGMYRVTRIEVRWAEEMPLSWEPAVVPLKQLGGDILISVDVAREQSQPAIPRLVAAG